jgi:hypothetical protein
VDWDNEKECFDTMAKELALFFSAEPPLKEDDTAEHADQDHPMTENNAAQNSYENDHKASYFSGFEISIRSPKKPGRVFRTRKRARCSAS